MVSEPYATSSAVYSTTGNCQLAAPATCLRAPSMNQGVHGCVCVYICMLICMLHLYACGCRLLTLIPTDEVGVLCAVDRTHAAGHAAPPHCLSPTTDTNCSTAPLSSLSICCSSSECINQKFTVNKSNFSCALKFRHN